jgi:hypothetical protein
MGIPGVFRHAGCPVPGEIPRAATGQHQVIGTRKLIAAFECGQQGQTMSDNDLWANAVACLKAACLATDQNKRAKLIHLGGVRLDLAHAPPRNDGEMASRISAMERMQAELIGRPRTLH